MTEAEWLACEDPREMLPLLAGKGKHRVPMLFSAACLRRAWHLVTDERCRSLIERTELFLDGLATEEEAARAYDAFQSAYVNGWLRNEGGGEIDEAVNDLAHVGFADAVSAAIHVACAVGDASSGDDLQPAWEVAVKAEKAAQTRLLRDVVGTPFRTAVVNPGWLTPVIEGLATTAYEERSLPSGHLDPARLSVLADALEEAGCADADLLGHLRTPGPHVRGCWALDPVLGKG